MFQSDEEHNLNSASHNDLNNGRSRPVTEQDLAKIDANLSAENIAVRKQQIARVFIKLIAIGLACGAVLGSGTYYLMHKFGLTTKPNQLKQERIEPQRQQLDQPLEQIKSTPDIFSR
ncbi:MAG: hypothetical protein AAFQ80_01890 [Cyanobacteria bacterium J06621_8]